MNCVSDRKREHRVMDIDSGLAQLPPCWSISSHCGDDKHFKFGSHRVKTSYEQENHNTQTHSNWIERKACFKIRPIAKPIIELRLSFIRPTDYSANVIKIRETIEGWKVGRRIEELSVLRPQNPSEEKSNRSPLRQPQFRRRHTIQIS